MKVGWSVRRALPQFPQKLTFACGAISDAEGHIRTFGRCGSVIGGVEANLVIDPIARCERRRPCLQWG